MHRLLATLSKREACQTELAVLGRVGGGFRAMAAKARTGLWLGGTNFVRGEWRGGVFDGASLLVQAGATWAACAARGAGFSCDQAIAFAQMQGVAQRPARTRMIT